MRVYITRHSDHNPRSSSTRSPKMSLFETIISSCLRTEKPQEPIPAPAHAKDDGQQLIEINPFTAPGTQEPRMNGFGSPDLKNLQPAEPMAILLEDFPEGSRCTHVLAEKVCTVNACYVRCGKNTKQWCGGYKVRTKEMKASENGNFVVCIEGFNGKTV
jgi:hypothetical protein